MKFSSINFKLFSWIRERKRGCAKASCVSECEMLQTKSEAATQTVHLWPLNPNIAIGRGNANVVKRFSFFVFFNHVSCIFMYLYWSFWQKCHRNTFHVDLSPKVMYFVTWPVEMVTTAMQFAPFNRNGSESHLCFVLKCWNIVFLFSRNHGKAATDLLSLVARVMTMNRLYLRHVVVCLFWVDVFVCVRG